MKGEEDCYDYMMFVTIIAVNDSIMRHHYFQFVLTITNMNSYYLYDIITSLQEFSNPPTSTPHTHPHTYTGDRMTPATLFEQRVLWESSWRGNCCFGWMEVDRCSCNLYS